MSETIALPKEVNAQRTITYRVDDEFLKELAECYEVEVSEVTLEMLMDYVKEIAWEDIAYSQYGIIFLDENGDEINV